MIGKLTAPRAALALALVGCSASLSTAQDSSWRSEKGPRSHVVARYHSGRIVGDRPIGCPRRYCGCASAKKLRAPNPGGILNLAVNWLRRFPRAAAAPGRACARPGHVFVILKVTGPRRVLAYDPNSGGGKTRVHERSIANCVVVDPHARRATM